MMGISNTTDYDVLMANVLLRKVKNITDINENATDLFTYCVAGCLFICLYIPAMICFIVGASSFQFGLSIAIGFLIGLFVGAIVGSIVYTKYRDHQIKILH
jgi:hypothetical protein